MSEFFVAFGDECDAVKTVLSGLKDAPRFQTFADDTESKSGGVPIYESIEHPEMAFHRPYVSTGLYLRN
jgi:hypothetical protein